VEEGKVLAKKYLARLSMIPKSGIRFSDKIMLNQDTSRLIRITDQISIDESELRKASCVRRARRAERQQLSTAVQLRFDVRQSPSAAKTM